MTVTVVTSTGDDVHPGSFTSPWKTIPHAKDTVAAGDIAFGLRAQDNLVRGTVATNQIGD